jgi:hypothetical protein
VHKEVLEMEVIQELKVHKVVEVQRVLEEL